MFKSIRFTGAVLVGALAMFLAACGGGGGSGSSSSSSSSTPTAAVSTGTVTAMGSVFVNGHEFSTNNANVIDDDSGATTQGNAALDVGMVVSVHSAANSTRSMPVASDIHINPLVRGFVDATNLANSSSSTNTITVMGQTIDLPASAAFVDHRACVTATTSPCTPMSGPADLVTTAGSTPGTYVVVHGFLFAGTSAQPVATLVSVQDYTSGSSLFKVLGQVSATSGTTLTIGAEQLDLSAATCNNKGASGPCASTSFAVNDVVAAFGTTAPSGATFAPAHARLSPLVPQTTGTTVEVEGKVTSVSGTTFVVRGITVDGSALTPSQIPAVGDRIEILGTIASNGTSVTATSIESKSAAAATKVLLAGPLGTVAAGSTSGTFNVTVLGQAVVVSSTTLIADRTVFPRPTFNITNFQTYLQGLTSPFVIVRAQVDSSGTLQAVGFDVVKAFPNSVVAIAGPADGAPTVGTPNSVMVHGVSVLYSTTMPANATIAAGTSVAAYGMLNPSGAIDTTGNGGTLFVFRQGGDRCLRGS